MAKSDIEKKVSEIIYEKSVELGILQDRIKEIKKEIKILLDSSIKQVSQVKIDNMYQNLIK